ncbi:MAG: SusC/RagA family protein, partial [Cytophagaceae bacterium]
MKKSYPWPRRRLLACCFPLLLASAAPVVALAGPTSPISVADWQLTGRVTSATGDGLPGVTVVLKGTSRGATSGPDGSFTLAVPETAGTLVFSFIGFQTQEHKFDGPGNVTIKMADDSQG